MYVPTFWLTAGLQTRRRLHRGHLYLEDYRAKNLISKTAPVAEPRYATDAFCEGT